MKYETGSCSDPPSGVDWVDGRAAARAGRDGVFNYALRDP